MIKDKRFYQFLHKQIPVLTFLSVFPGLGYIFLGWLYDVHLRAIIWYIMILLVSFWGFRLYRNFDFDEMSRIAKQRWYAELSYYYYAFFILWTVIFILYAGETESNLHYIAIFTQIGASVVASTLLSSDKKLFTPAILILMIPLVIYFANIGEWYGYVLTIFACIFTWVLFYSSTSSFNLLMKTSFQASHDLLTGLHNRYFFIGHLQETMNSLKESNHYSYLLLIDLDYFKTINDSLGHDIGDQLLQEVSTRFRKIVPRNNLVARLGGDEFIITGANYETLSECQKKAMELSNQLLSALKEIYVIDRHNLYISSSIGVSLIDASISDANNFIKEADIAMYEVKAKGRDGVYLFNKEMSERVEMHLEIERRLHFVLEKNEITLNYQPQYDKNKKIIGTEALARWRNEKLGDISPVDFIPIAEQTGIIVELGNYILKSGFQTLREWHENGIHLKQFSINISMRQFFHSTFIAEVKRLARLYLTEELMTVVVFEVTESIIAEDIDKVITIINEIKSLGIRFSMDDFGTGYSSLSYLTQLPIDEIKIDRAFVNALEHSEGDQAMITTILHMADIFKLNIVAEGVETDAQFDFLARHDCSIFQGYLFSPPITKDKFSQLYSS
ncbi:MAG: bifunctional diguanylate cyclase/phosphodiesterase [Gammaproteobacteria bacterium]|nr:bifunctional diguanylate cyclase/phosphodiesterase [Gammaproteobacteria bacterium]